MAPRWDRATPFDCYPWNQNLIAFSSWFLPRFLHPPSWLSWRRDPSKHYRRINADHPSLCSLTIWLAQSRASLSSTCSFSLCNGRIDKYPTKQKCQNISIRNLHRNSVRGSKIPLPRFGIAHTSFWSYQGLVSESRRAPQKRWTCRPTFRRTLGMSYRRGSTHSLPD